MIACGFQGLLVSAKPIDVTVLCGTFLPFQGARVEWQTLEDDELVVRSCDQVFIDLPRDKCPNPARAHGQIDD